MAGDDFAENKDYHSYITKMFRCAAPFYDITRLFLGNLRKRTVEVAGKITPETKIIDFCTGTGEVVLEFAKKSNNVAGIDISPAMLKRAKQKDKNNRIRFMEMDASQTPFKDKEFDIASISYGLHDIPQPVRDKVLEEMKRVARKIIVVDYNPPRQWLLKWLYIFLISVYESKYFRDFIRRDLEEMLTKHNLEVIKETYAVCKTTKIYVCKERGK